MAYLPRVTIPALEGIFAREVPSSAFQRQGIEAGTNANSASLLTITWSALLADSPIDPLKPRSTHHCFINGLLTDYKGKILELSSLWDDIVSQVVNPGPDALLSENYESCAPYTCLSRDLTFREDGVHEHISLLDDFPPLREEGYL
jgi:hypothetical protein